MRITGIIVGIVLILLGGLWILQGSNMMAGSVMSGQSQWLYTGIVVAIVGIVALVWALAPPLMAGRIVILNGAPRSGKTSIARVVQDTFDGIWVNLGVDVYMAATRQLSPSIGLRPGGERPLLEPKLPLLFAGVYESIAAHSRLGLNVVADFGHHDVYSKPLGILPDCARRLAGLPVLFVGVRCPIETIMARRNADPQGGFYETGTVAPPTVTIWQEAVHTPGIYDLEVDTSVLDPEQCAAEIATALANPPAPSAFEKLAKL